MTTEPVQIYRLRVAVTSGSAGWGDWRYFENYDKFLEDLTDAAISAVAHDYRNKSRSEWLPTKEWNKLVLDSESERTHVDRIVGADKLVDGQWVPLNYTFHPPRLELEE